MLVIARRRNQEVMFGTTVKLMVVGFGPGRVRLGIKAPRALEVHRNEVWMLRLREVAMETESTVAAVYERLLAQGISPLFFQGKDPRGKGAGLVLSRYRKESIIIGGPVSVHVLDIRGGDVQLGIDAPTQLPVHRMEDYNAIEQKRAEEIRQEVHQG